MPAKFYRIKEEVRILGLDDSPFRFQQSEEVLVVGCVFRGGLWLDGVLSTHVTVDGLDATEKTIRLVKECKFKDLRVIMLDGLSFGGFNMLDLEEINQKTKLPVMAVTRVHPDFASIEKALRQLPHFKERWQCIKKAGEPLAVETKPGKKIQIQFRGLEQQDAVEIVKLASTRSLLPEPIRVAHLIAQGIVLGESKGRA